MNCINDQIKPLKKTYPKLFHKLYKAFCRGPQSRLQHKHCLQTNLNPMDKL